MHSRAKSRLFISIISIFIVTAGVYMILYNLEESIVFFYPPSKIHNVNIDKDLRVGGVIKIGSITKKNIKDISFVITDNIKDLTVSYSGILPPMFREGQGVVAQGKVINGIFIANQLLTKHDENYKPPDIK